MHYETQNDVFEVDFVTEETIAHTARLTESCFQGLF